MVTPFKYCSLISCHSFLKSNSKSKSSLKRLCNSQNKYEGDICSTLEPLQNKILRAKI